MASYPTGVKSFTGKNTGDVIQAAHVGDLQDEVAAIETGLLSGLQHGLTISTGGLTVSTGNATFGQQVRAPGQPRTLVYSTAVQSFPAGAFTAVTFENEEFDVGGLHSTATNPARITVPAGSSGLYLFGLTMRPSTGGAGDAFTARIVKNSTTEVSGAGAIVRSSNSAPTVSLSAPIVADGSDFFEVEVFPATSTGSLPSAGNVRRAASEFWCVKLW